MQEVTWFAVGAGSCYLTCGLITTVSAMRAARIPWRRFGTVAATFVLLVFVWLPICAIEAWRQGGKR